MSFDSLSGHLTENRNTVELFIVSDNEIFEIDFKINELENTKMQLIILTFTGMDLRTVGFSN